MSEPGVNSGVLFEAISMALTAKKISTLEEGRHGDGRGLYLQVTASGARSWLLRYERHGRERAMGLGSFEDFTLEEARDRARKARQLLKDGIDPIDARRETRNAQVLASTKAAARNVTFKDCAAQYFNFHSSKWKNRKHAAQFLSTLETYAYPVFGKLPVASIDKSHVLTAIEPIWLEKTETASRLRGRIEAVLDFAQVRGYREGDNPAEWSGNLKHLLPAPTAVTKVKHHAALPYSDLPVFIKNLADRTGVAARALEFLVFTAGRTGEVLGARWEELDVAGKTWIVPADRMKAKKEHRVPLSEPAIVILKAIPRESDYVFPGAKPNVALSNMAMAELLKRMDRLDITVHGFRSTFRDWAAETTDYPNYVVEMALAHVVGNRVEAAYRRGDLFEKRRQLMAAWAEYCLGEASEAPDSDPARGAKQ
jgi:integrase